MDDSMGNISTPNTAITKFKKLSLSQKKNANKRKINKSPCSDEKEDNSCSSKSGDSPSNRPSCLSIQVDLKNMESSTENEPEVKSYHPKIRIKSTEELNTNHPNVDLISFDKEIAIDKTKLPLQTEIQIQEVDLSFIKETPSKTSLQSVDLSNSCDNENRKVLKKKRSKKAFKEERIEIKRKLTKRTNLKNITEKYFEPSQTRIHNFFPKKMNSSTIPYYKTFKESRPRSNLDYINEACEKKELIEIIISDDDDTTSENIPANVDISQNSRNIIQNLEHQINNKDPKTDIFGKTEKHLKSDLQINFAGELKNNLNDTSNQNFMCVIPKSIMRHRNSDNSSSSNSKTISFRNDTNYNEVINDNNNKNKSGVYIETEANCYKQKTTNKNTSIKEDSNNIIKKKSRRNLFSDNATSSSANAMESISSSYLKDLCDDKNSEHINCSKRKQKVLNKNGNEISITTRQLRVRTSKNQTSVERSVSSVESLNNLAEKSDSLTFKIKLHEKSNKRLSFSTNLTSEKSSKEKNLGISNTHDESVELLDFDNKFETCVLHNIDMNTSLSTPNHFKSASKAAKTPEIISKTKKRAQTTIKKQKSKQICPSYKIIEGTTFAVDAFRFGDIEGITHYFLTHFHADHYIGLKKSFDKPLFLSEITANLVESFIKIDRKYLNVISLNTFINVNGIEVTAVDANHCPGAVMFLFRFPNGSCTLHTGDFRASPVMEEEPVFWNNNVDTIYLDTTYLNSRYDFKPQCDSISEVLETVNNFRLKNIGENILYVCGSYVIGKEKVWTRIAEELNIFVWTEGNRRKALECINDKEKLKLLKDDPHDAQLHILNLGKLSYDYLSEYLRNYSDYYTKILAIRPSGWEKGSKPQYRGRINIVGIEYSEHSSYHELRRFVRYLNPKKCISTVSFGTDLSKTPKIPSVWFNNEVRSIQKGYQTSITNYVCAKKITQPRTQHNSTENIDCRSNISNGLLDTTASYSDMNNKLQKQENGSILDWLQ